jgi:hypothetical protein
MLLSLIVTFVMSLVTICINYLLSYSIEILSDMERHKTKSDRVTSLIFKIVVTQSINTAFIYTILYLINHINPLATFGLVG